MHVLGFWNPNDIFDVFDIENDVFDAEDIVFESKSSFSTSKTLFSTSKMSIGFKNAHHGAPTGKINYLITKIS